MKKVMLIALVAVCAMGCCKKTADNEGKCCDAAQTECAAEAAEATEATADTAAVEVVEVAAEEVVAE